MKRTVLILGDQLHEKNPAFDIAEPDTTRVLLVTSRAALASKRWHRQRLHLVLAGMGKLARSFRERGYEVDERVSDDMTAGIKEHRADFAVNDVVAMAPMSWRSTTILNRAGVSLVPNNQFLCDETMFNGWAATQKNRMKMEDFYRWQRLRLNVLVEPNGAPVGGKWNYDDQNREPPPKDGRSWPAPEYFPPDHIDE